MRESGPSSRLTISEASEASPHERSLRSRKSPRRDDRAPLNEQTSALQYAYRLLSYRDRSEKELRVRLSMKGFTGHTIDNAIDGLTSKGFLDDRRLAVSLKRFAQESKYLSISGTKRFLRERGIPRDIVDTVVMDMDEVETAQKIVEKKMRLKGDIPGFREIRRLYGALSRKGYSQETIKKALEHFTIQEDCS